MSIQIDYQASWINRLRGRMIEQWKGLPNLDAIVQAIAAQSQDLENAAQSLLSVWDIDGSSGVQLDRLGVIVGRPRGGVIDSTYRLYLRAQIAVNRSNGSVTALYAVLQAMFGYASGSKSLLYQPGGDASLSMLVIPPISDAAAAVAAQLLGEAASAGVRVELISQSDVDAAMFETAAGGAWLAGDQAHGATVLTLPAGYVFPSSGSLVIDAGLPAVGGTGQQQELINYSSVVNNAFGTFIHLVGSTQFDHLTNSDVSYTQAAGLGWGDTSNGATGGKLASALQG